MKRIIQYSLEDGKTVFIEVEEGSSRIGLGDEVIEKANQTLDTALETVKPVAQTIINKIQDLSRKPNEVEVKFGLKMSVGLGAVFAASTAEANYEITLKWKN